MECTVDIIRKNEHQTNYWSGGTTTQLYIYPKDANYSDRNFKWRLSSAKVEAEESEFTHLPGISRIIMIIDGEILLEHEGKHKVSLHPFEQDSFMGDWTTKSFGKVTDFNLMMAESCAGRLEAMSLEGDGWVNIQLCEAKEDSKQIANAFYVVNGEISVVLENNRFDLYEGDLYVATHPANGATCELNVYNNLSKECTIIRSVILY